MELVADGAVGVREEVERVLDSVEQRRDQLADAMLTSIRDEIGPYDRPENGSLPDDVREHCRLHVELLLRSLRRERDPDRDDLAFAREAAARRVHQGIPLDGLLQAFRVGHRTLWQAIVDSASETPAGRQAAIALAGEAMEYIDLASTHVAEAYLRESGQLAELIIRRRRDLLENLLAGRLPADEAEAESLGLHGDAELVVAAGTLDGDGGEGHRSLAQAADAITRSVGSKSLVVTRQTEVVAVLPVGTGRPAVREAMESAARTLADEHGIQLLVGVSGISRGAAEIGRRYVEARLALRRATAESPVVSLSEFSAFEHLVAAADRSTQRSIAMEAGRLTDTGDPALMETLRAYLDAELDVNRAAESLFVHPNTVRYRLRRIGELTGIDTQRFSGLVELLTIARLSEIDSQ